MLDWITTPTCMALNTYLCGALATSIGISIFWFFKYCAAKGKYLEMRAVYGME